MAKLVVITKGLTAVSHELGDKWVNHRARTTATRSRFVEPSISGRHCEVRLRGDELVVRDLLSTNGTFVDDKKIIRGAF